MNPDNAFFIKYPKIDTTNMIRPVVCNHCGETYDLADAKLIHRFTDCDLFTTPCCEKKSDTRTWKSLPDYKEI
jgi:hypothetical protein